MLNICHPLLVAAVALLTGAVSSPAWAQTVPPPPVPQPPDQPLPEWRPPMHRRVDVVRLTTGPEAEQAQKFRQAGLWIASIAGASLFTGGIVYVAAAGVNDDLSHPNDVRFDPALEDKRNRMETAAVSLLAIGGVSIVTGFGLFAWGQHQLRMHHKKYPRDPLPPLSGY